jgi:flavodoxin/ferredoxin
MTKACVVYFSQTGNTEKVALAISAKMESLGASVISLDVADAEDFPEAFHGIDILGVGFPVFFGYPPSTVVDFIRGMEDGNGRSAFVFTTYGGCTSGDSLLDAAKELSAKGYRILGGLKLEAKDNYPLSLDLHINEGRPNAQDIASAEEFAEKILKAHGSGRSIVPATLASENPYFIKHRGHRHADVSSTMRRYVEGKIRFNSKNCLFCETCKRNCPTKSITSGEKYPEFSWKCFEGGLRCYQCVRACPGKALTVDYPVPFDVYRNFLESIADTPAQKAKTSIVAE